MFYIICAYCDQEISSEEIPAIDDDAAWASTAEEHAEWCEWVETRALRLIIFDGKD
jgi:hypothetical protein